MGVKSTDTDKSYLNVFNSSVDDRYGPLGGGGGGGPSGPYGVSATGGTTYTPGNGYKYHKFAYPNSTSFVVTDAGPGTIDVLLVGGGGGTGPGYNSGAGGGGVVHHSQFPISVQTYPVTIGNGGANPNSPGADSSFGGMTAKGGGGGTNYGGPAGKDGGSGGGAEGTETNPAGEGIQPTQNSPFTPSPYFNQYGNDGGTGTTSGAYSAAGGGGAGAAGDPAGPGPGAGGKGGAGQPFQGFEYPIVGLSALAPEANSPTNDHYGAGGGGWGYSTQFSGGRPVGGGGRGGNSVPSAQSDGLDGLGAGAGNSYYQPGTNVGGDGILLIRYPEPTAPAGASPGTIDFEISKYTPANGLVSQTPYSDVSSGDSYTFTDDGFYTIVIPGDSADVTFDMWAWGAGGGPTPGPGPGNGGAGGGVRGRGTFSGPTTITFIVGSHGTHSSPGWPDGGNTPDEGGGGGSSRIGENVPYPSRDSSSTQYLLIGGGGGGGHSWMTSGTFGGSGGYPSGNPGGGYYPADGSDNIGSGGTQSAGGAAGAAGRQPAGTAGSKYQGGPGTGGGGGGGYYGGGGAGGYYAMGGGGSGYIDSTLSETGSFSASPGPQHHISLDDPSNPGTKPATAADTGYDGFVKFTVVTN